MRKGSIVVALCAALATLAFAGTATAGGGNSDNAKKCQKGGWQNWVRADQTPFANQDECVSYGAKGGTLTVPTSKSASQVLCESLGGAFALGVAPVVWTCHVSFADNVSANAAFLAMSPLCFADGGDVFSSDWSTAAIPATMTCQKFLI